MNRLFYRIKKLKQKLIDRPLPEDTWISDRYHIKRVIGLGSFGITYLCRDQETRKLCVVKQVKPSRRKDKASIEMYENEVSIMKVLNHPAIPKFISSFQYKGHLFFAMDYVNGENIEDAIFAKGDRYREKEALLFMEELLDIVEYIHSQGIIHRDIRLPNVIKADGNLFLIDFGLARFLHDQIHSDFENLENYPVEKRLRRQNNVSSDFYALGHFLLYLLYSSFESDSKDEQPWEQELNITNLTKQMIKRMLQSEDAYHDIHELRNDLKHSLSNISS
ncbi:serine/threonine protein kinase [Scopulibacillus cellulosilyticus]|uniref:Serine/threonine protein kinase n=1 Tax=Scopulibacillus cellulosilyticus TaxID=2665665 RepID=A0ABW2Q037_9BACL